jgi:putative ABC transport system permease protein
MLLNYLKTTLRNFYRHLSYTLINILGLTIGLATSVLIYLWIVDEFSYEKHYRDIDRIFAAVSNIKFSDGRLETGFHTSGLLAERIATDFPEVESAARTDWGSDRLLRTDEKSILQRGMLADPSVFKVFNFVVIAGDKVNPMPDLTSVVLTESCANRLFPEGDALGKTIRAEEKLDLRVTAIIKDQVQTQLKFDFLAPYAHAIKDSPWMLEWDNTNDKTFVKLKADVSQEAFNEKLANYIKSKCATCNSQVWLQNYADTRLYTNYSNGRPDGGRIAYVQIFSVIGIFILVIASINFMNLATARSATRSREVGVRKAVGAHRKMLFFQFMSESMLMALIALVLALAAVQVALPAFNAVTEKQVYLDFSNPAFWLSMFCVVFITGFIAGSYPSLFLSAFKPAQVLKGSGQVSLSGNGIRKSLVVFQFVLSIVLIICSVIIFRQVQFIKTKNLGFDRTSIVVINMHEGLKNNRNSFKNEASNHTSIKSLTFAGQDPFDVSWNTSSVVWPGKQNDERISFSIIAADKDFVRTLGLTLQDGRDFVDNISDSTNYIINERAAQVMGLENPIGASLNVWGNPAGKVIGLIKDFHNNHFSKAITPQIIMAQPETTWTVFAKLENQNTEAGLAHLEKVVKRFEPNYPFQYQFLDDKFQAEYKLENTTEKISFYFTVVAVFISCLGLFGLASFTAERRTKELGVRKVLGASLSNLVTMLCSDFAKLVLIAIAIACPVAYYIMNLFLEKYTYHTELSLMIFVLSGSVILIIAILTVLYQSLKAAIANPVDSLRSE